MRYSNTNAVNFPRRFEWRGKFYRFSDTDWRKITRSVKAPITNEIVTLMRGSKSHTQACELAKGTILFDIILGGEDENETNNQAP